MTEHTKEKIKTEILERNLSLEEILDKYPQFDHWTLRKFYANIKREQVIASVEAQAFSLPVFEQPLSKKAVEAIHAGWMRPIQLNIELSGARRPSIPAPIGAKQYVVISDVHAPDHDRAAMDVMYQIGQSVVPNELIINGDLFDAASLSRYVPSSEQHLRWADERQEAVKVVAEIRQNFASIPIRFIPGNHDIRPLNWVNSNALPLQGLLTLEQWLGIDDPSLGIEVVHEGIIRLAQGNLAVKHGVKIGQHAGTSVKKEVDAHGLSVIMGHVHRRAIVEVTKTAHQLVGIELGCLCNLRPSYLAPEETANWQHGFAVVTEFEDGKFEVELVRINNGRALFRGKVFQSRV
jgi:UDP-2,3-diacylglucosamine pyrophosphatase LpxH